LSQYVTNHTDFGSRGEGKVSILVLNAHNKLQLMLIKNKYSFKNVKLRYFGKITGFTFDENHGFRDP